MYQTLSSMLSPGKKLFYSTFFLVSFIFLFLYIYILTSNTIPGVPIIYVQVKVTFESVKKHNVLHGWLQTVIIRNTGVLLYKDINFWSSLYLLTQPCIHRRAVKLCTFGIFIVISAPSHNQCHQLHFSLHVMLYKSFTGIFLHTFYPYLPTCSTTFGSIVCQV